MARLQIENHMGWHEQGDGKWFIGLPIISGRIRDSENAKIRSGLKHIVKTYSPTLHFTAEQHLLLGNISSSAKDLLTNDLRAYGILLHEDFSPSAERMLACVSLPTCGLALAEAERIQTPTTNLLDSALQKHGIAREPITLRISGCPNGCSRPYAAEIALVGRMPGHYSLFLGGKANGTALADKIFDRVPFADLENTLDKIIEIFVKQRAANEEFGEFCARIKTDSIKQQLVSSLENYKWAKA
jgi:sulfite reductase (ferredoxin)